MSFSIWSWNGVVTENKANKTCENINSRFEILSFQQPISVQR